MAEHMYEWTDTETSFIMSTPSQRNNM